MGENINPMNFLKMNGIRREFTNSYTPQQIGAAKRKNKTIVEIARSKLKAKQLGNEFWAEAVHTAIYTLNRCSRRVVSKLTQKEAWSRYKPNIVHMRIFGCIAYAHVPKEKRKKLDDKSINCIFIRYNTKNKSYRLFDPHWV